MLNCTLVIFTMSCQLWQHSLLKSVLLFFPENHFVICVAAATNVWSHYRQNRHSKEKKKTSQYWKWAYYFIKKWSMWCEMQIQCRNGCLATEMLPSAKKMEKDCLTLNFGFDGLFNQQAWEMFVEKLFGMNMPHTYCVFAVHGPWTPTIHLIQSSVKQKRKSRRYSKWRHWICHAVSLVLELQRLID